MWLPHLGACCLFLKILSLSFVSLGQCPWDNFIKCFYHCPPQGKDQDFRIQSCPSQMMNGGTKKAPASGQGTPDVLVLAPSPTSKSFLLRQGTASFWYIQSFLKPLSVSAQANSALSLPAPSSHRKHLIMTSKSQNQKTTKSNSFSLVFHFPRHLL